MLSRTRTVDPRLLQRQCVACGYDGALLRAGRAERCARCGCDLSERPARSYAEMEGLAEPGPSRPFAPPADTQRQRLFRRWLAFMLLVTLLLVVVVYLCAAAFPL